MRFNCGDIDYVYSRNSNTSLDNCDDQDFVLDYIRDKFSSPDNECDSFLVGNMDDVECKFRQWESCLPRVKPFYAIKCNPDPLVLRYLAMQGTGFDCASKAEIEQVLAIGVPATSIIFANPCKFTKHIQAAEQLGVKRTTFDSVAELHKIAKLWPAAELVLRVLPKVFKAQCPLGLKFGATEEEVPELLQVATDLGLNIIGVSFHVGSGCLELDAWSDSVRFVRRVFDLAKTYNYHLRLVDVGGGFPGNKASSNGLTFSSICEGLNQVLDECFPATEEYEIIAEPGRYFVASAFTLATQVHSVRKTRLRQKVEDAGGDGKEMVHGYHYYISDGLYGSFNNIMYDHAIVQPVLFQANGKPILPEDRASFMCKIFGPTCDSADVILENVEFPKLELGDWLIWHDMGAYTHAASSTFNGISRPSVFYVREMSYEVLEAQRDELDICHSEEEASSSEDESELNVVMRFVKEFKRLDLLNQLLKPVDSLVSPRLSSLKNINFF